MSKRTTPKKALKSAKRDSLLDEAMQILRPNARKAGVSQEEYLVGVLKGKYPAPAKR